MSICFGKWRPGGAVGVLLFVVMLCKSPHAYPQSGPTSVPIPVATNKLGQFDTPALAEVLAHLNVVGTTAWIAMQGTGTITYGSDQTSNSATLTIVGTSKFRLDGQTSTGPITIRINGNMGKIQLPNGKVLTLPPETAGSGILQFELPRSSDLQTNSSILDHGLTIVDSVSLHRITIERQLTGQQNLATDFYFDPKTHLLVKTTNAIRPYGARSDLLTVVTYGDYRLVDGVMIPFLYTQSLDGQKQWTLQLSEVQLNPNIQSNYFDF